MGIMRVIYVASVWGTNQSSVKPKRPQGRAFYQDSNLIADDGKPRKKLGDKLMYYKVTIDETGRDSLRDEAAKFNQVIETFKTVDEAKAYLTERYGTIPKRTHSTTIYVDFTDGAKPVGFLHSYWNKDISHNSKSWYQTDWVSVTEVNEMPVMVN
jgi:hypothetical protein